MDLSLYVLIWAALTVVVLAMAAYRWVLVRHEDATLNVLESPGLAAEQARVFRKANGIERWGVALTVVVLIYGLALGAAYLYHLWQVSSQVPK